MLELTNVKESTREYVMISNITRFAETKEGTAIYFGGREPGVVVSEKVADIERQGGAFGVLKVVKK